MCSPATSVSPDRRQYLLQRSELAAREGMRAIVEATLSRSFPEAVIHDRGIYEAYRARFLANDPVGYALANQAFASSDLDSAIAALQCPCLVLAGAHDLLRPPKEVEAFARRLGNARFEVIESGHLISVQAPDALSGRLLQLFANEH